MSGFGTIVLTTDFSETSKRAFPSALEIARKFGSKILVVYVEEERLPPFVGEYTLTSIEEIMSAQEKRIAEELRSLVAAELGGDVETESLVVLGTPHIEIVRIAAERDADLIVMATHGRSGLAHMLIGGVTERVVRKAPCPVLTVRPEGHQFVMP